MIRGDEKRNPCDSIVAKGSRCEAEKEITLLADIAGVEAKDLDIEDDGESTADPNEEDVISLFQSMKQFGILTRGFRLMGPLFLFL